MDKILTLLLVLSYNIFIAQNQFGNIIKYELSGTFFDTLEFSYINEFLIFDDHKSYYFNSFFEDKRDAYQIINNYDLKKGSEKILSYYDNDFIYQITSKPKSNTPILTSDKIHLIWDITNTKKNILGYDCFLATTIFRGRKYYAYFTLDIPYSIGPWKLKGLPGLILEVYDSENVYKYTATEIKLNSNDIEIPKIVLDFVNQNDIYKQNYIDIANLKTKQLEEIRNMQLASLPKGTIIRKIDHVRKWLREISFE